VILSFAEARRRKGANRRARWKDIVGDLDSELWPQVRASFHIRPGQTVFTIGSCFARNIEDNLKALGCQVPMLDFRLPPHEYDGAPHSAMNRFHPPAFRQCLEWTAAVHDRDGVVTWRDCEPLAFDFGDGRWFDLDMAAALAVPMARFIERRQHIHDIFSRAFDADALMITPGLIEAWRDLTTGLYTYTPNQRQLLEQPDRWSFEVLPYAKCLEDLLATIDIVRARNPGVKVLITTSPVPMNVTFSGRDIAIANTHSKAVLRAVCEEIVGLREQVDYFPSYEIVTMSNSAQVWEKDRRHVAHGFIGKIVGYMLDHYLEGVEAFTQNYQRAKMHLAAAEFVEAEKAARAALDANLAHGEARIILGLSLLEQHRWAEAQEMLAPIAEGDPERCAVRVALARAMAGQDLIGEAVALLESTMARPSFAIADFREAWDLLAAAPADDAIRLGERATELFPLNPQVYRPLVAAYLRSGRKPEAIQSLRRATSLSNPGGKLLLQLADLLTEAGEFVEARVWADAALTAEPSNKAAAAFKAKLMRRLETTSA
jgi:hypothetical protein